MPKLTARWVLPIEGPPIENGVVEIDGGIIAAVGSGNPRGATDYGDAVLMPGLINAHTHLQYTVLRGFLEDVPFFPWIRTLNALKSRLTDDDWAVSAQLGAAECLASGITAIGDNADAAPVTAAARNCGLGGVIYQEVFGIDERETVNEIVAALALKVEANRSNAGSRLAVGISPHALYTVRPQLMTALVAWSAANLLPMSIHVAESAAESALTLTGEGPFAEMFATRGIDWRTPHQTPTAYVDNFGALRAGTLAIHCVNQTPADIEILTHCGASVVHCPKSNAKLGSGIAPVTAWLAQPGVNVAIGTDSAVSNNAHDLFEEMRFGLLLQRAATGNAVAVTAAQMLRMATMGGAKALGIDARAGALTTGKRADIIAVDLSGAHNVPATDPASALLYSARAADVIATIIDGETVYERGRYRHVDIETIKSQARAIRSKLTAHPETTPAFRPTLKDGERP